MTQVLDYSQHLADGRRVLHDAKFAGQTITAEMAVICLEADRFENVAYRKSICAEFDIPLREFDSELRLHIIRQTLGSVPKNAADYVENWLKANKVKVNYDGALSKDRGYVMFDGIKHHLEPQDYETDDAAMKLMIACQVAGPTTGVQLQTEMRVLAANLKLTYGRDEIDDAFSIWKRKAQMTRKEYLISSILTGAAPTLKQAQTDLVTLCEQCFTDDAKFAAAVICKFIHQVKRKALGLPVFDHLMPVLLGKQRSGKSTLMRELIKPLVEMRANVDFKMITDERIIDIWQNLILVCDEMGWASKSDIDIIKNVITADVLQRRPMRSNDTETVRQQATLIGASNQVSLSALIRDNTGNRRFVSLHTVDRMPIEAVLSLDWLAVWQSVDYRAADPLEGFADVLAERQEDEREQSHVEQWLANIVPETWMTKALAERSRFAANELYDDFREYEDRFFPGRGTDLAAWRLEMTRVMSNPNPLFKKARAKHGMVYDYVGTKPGLRVVK